MKEILFINGDECVNALIKDLRSKLDARIDLADDFSSGLKEVFDRHPAVVFIKKDSENVSVENLARQVKTLLDEEDLRLYLLQDESSQRYSKTANFDDSFDLCLPFEELTRQIQQMLRTIPGLEWKIPAADEDIPTLMTEPSPFFDQDAPAGADIVDVTLDQSHSDDFLAGFPFPEILNPLEPSSPSPPEKPDTSVSLFNPEELSQLEAHPKSKPAREALRSEKETPHQLFGSMTDEELNNILFRNPDSLSSTQPDTVAADSTKGMSQFSPAGNVRPTAPRTTTSTAQPPPSGFAAKPTRQPSPSTASRGSAGQKQQFEKKTSIVFKGYIVIAVIILTIATIFLVRQWHIDMSWKKLAAVMVKNPDKAKPLQTESA